MTYSKYGWVGNKIKDEDMKKLYLIKQEINIPITDQVAEAVGEYIARKERRCASGKRPKIEKKL